MPVPETHSHDMLPEEREALRRVTVIHLLRMAYFVIILVITFLVSVDITEQSINLKAGWRITVPLGLLLLTAFLLFDVLTPRKRITTIAGVFLGVLVGLLATFAVGSVIDLLSQLYNFDQTPAQPLVSAIKILVGIALIYVAITTVLQTQDDFRLVIPYVEFAKQIRGPRPLLLDTSAIIDARILDVAQTGIIQYPIVVPQFVIDELQTLADSEDRMKRARGRRGLDVVGKLQRTPTLDLTIDQTPVPGKAVDQMLVELARRMPATILTTDIALNRVAGIQGVKVLNLNEVANALKPALIPGEQVSIKLIKEGEQRGQGVGYLEDGTMVVAEDGQPYIGQRVTLNITSTLQTAAGRLLFGRVMDGSARPAEPRHPVQSSPSDGPKPETPAETAPADVGDKASRFRNPRR